MSPGAHTVARTRWAVRVALRLALLATLLMLVWTVYDEVGAHRKNMRSIAVLVGGGTPPGGPSVFRFLDTTWQWLMIGGLLLAADLVALPLLVPLPRRGCPGCGYAVDLAKQERCPECGLELAASGNGAGQAKEAPHAGDPV